MLMKITSLFTQPYPPFLDIPRFSNYDHFLGFGFQGNDLCLICGLELGMT